MEIIKRLNGRKANLILGTFFLMAAVVHLFIWEPVPAWIYVLIMTVLGGACIDLAKYKS